MGYWTLFGKMLVNNFFHDTNDLALNCYALDNLACTL